MTINLHRTSSDASFNAENDPYVNNNIYADNSSTKTDLHEDFVSPDKNILVPPETIGSTVGLAIDSLSMKCDDIPSSTDVKLLSLTKNSLSLINRSNDDRPKQRLNHGKGSKANSINIYQRLLGKKSSTTIKSKMLIMDEASLSVTSMKDRFFSFMSGESEEVNHALCMH